MGIATDTEAAPAYEDLFAQEQHDSQTGIHRTPIMIIHIVKHAIGDLNDGSAAATSSTAVRWLR
ncbi:hypothetical protein NUU61_000579 [Penicillium alfredii]|uniref:Uncharacterized protein n=1 Tax=Penicillium alfredii TaxID=1506179 RepID=A0A9W9G9U3_9EURO|nr:uncharacterized protein NUU61_000579 [Penicillium alfredii]KAJ5114820.1 hypothetical protein NUU61_000579 [Penicillium alfredii]